MSDLSIYLRISELPPLPQRLRELVAAFSRWGYDAIYLDWGGGFPWTLDERFRDEDHYEEGFVAGIYREARVVGIEPNTVFPGPESLYFAARIRSYGHLFRRRGTHTVLDLGQPAARKFFEDLVDDLIALVPNPGTVMIEVGSSRPVPDETAFLADCFHERGLAVVARRVPGIGRRWEATDETLSRFDAVVVPASSSVDRGTVEGERSLRERTILSSRGRKDVEASIRSAGSGGGTRGKDRHRPRLLLSFQSERKGWGRGGGSSILSQSIEPALEDIRLLGCCQRESDADGDDLAVPRCALLANELNRTVANAWNRVRAIHEGLAARSLSGSASHGLNGREDQIDLREALRLLDRDRREAYRLVGALVDELSPFIERRRIERTLMSTAVPLHEEYHLLAAQIVLLESSYDSW